MPRPSGMMDLQDAILVALEAVLNAKRANANRKRRSTLLDNELSDLRRAHIVLEAEYDRIEAEYDRTRGSR